MLALKAVLYSVIEQPETPPDLSAQQPRTEAWGPDNSSDTGGHPGRARVQAQPLELAPGVGDAGCRSFGQSDGSGVPRRLCARVARFSARQVWRLAGIQLDAPGPPTSCAPSQDESL